MSGDDWQGPMESDLAADQWSPEEIEWEIKRTRERMSSNIAGTGETRHASARGASGQVGGNVSG